MSWDEAQKWLGPWLPLLATVAGWAVVNHQNNHREVRKEERALVDGAKKLIVELAHSARDYMCAPSRNQATEADIKSGLEQIEIELKRLPGYSKDAALVAAMARLADDATSADFESASRRPRQPSEPEPQALMLARNLLMMALEASFARRYRRK
jgi:hypothetical protein